MKTGLEERPVSREHHLLSGMNPYTFNFCIVV